MKRKLPILLIYFRLLAGIVILLLAIFQSQSRGAMCFLLIAGLLSDIFDGIVARRLGVSNEKLRRLDSAVDQLFWLLIAAACYILAPAFFEENGLMILMLLGAEAAIYVISYLRFRKEVATHAIASKVWTLTLAGTFAQLLLTSNSGILFQVCFYLGMATRLEIIAILLLLKQWTADVPSVYHAVQLRRNRPIKRNKLFNG